MSALETGLCAACRWARGVENARGGRFTRCGRSDEDAQFARYPRLPVVRCEGFAPLGGTVPRRSAVEYRAVMPIELPERPRGTPFERIGGREVVERVVDVFYDRMEADELLRPLFPDDMTAGREKQKAFMEEWLGGTPRYSSVQGHPMLRRRHLPFVIGEREAGRWLHHMTAALRECDVDPALVAEILQRLGPLAHHMVNEGQDVPREPFEPPRMPQP